MLISAMYLKMVRLMREGCVTVLIQQLSAFRTGRPKPTEPVLILILPKVAAAFLPGGSVCSRDGPEVRTGHRDELTGMN